MRRGVVLALAVLTPLTGCATAPTRVDFRPGVPPVTTGVREDAGYVLSRTDGPGGVVETVHLPRGAQLGFGTAPDGSLVAVAGDHVIPLVAGQYTWLREALSPAAAARDRRFRRLRNIAVAAACVLLVVGLVGTLFIGGILLMLGGKSFPNFI